ncbi:protein downstream neighbor of son homolog [Episyrphus balteatus]|uniref:protein downstream neighbor of son homolog n=1 Tax=Episyrphus balteatus TaxID=286459 RepID=UPI00248695E6|nr:protein downstream neighbor of son homolog [Episyrphus balteatus]
MASTNSNTSLSWKKPDELIRLHRLQQKKKQLTARLNNNKANIEITPNDKEKLLEAVIAQKRKNPFAKSSETSKKLKSNGPELIDDDSVLSLITTPPVTKQVETVVKETPQRSPPAKLTLKPFDPKAFSELFSKESHEDDSEIVEQQKFTKNLPVDWSLKTRARFFCETDMPATKLKTSQEASGLTGFVRCIDTRNSSGGLDISPAARLNQATYYWQHPHLPWLTMFPRNSKDNNGIHIGERERKSLAVDWSDSFRGLFQLLRARQCPYFYLCANSFTILFRAAGIGGRVETHALMAPTSKGMRSSLRQEGIEFSLPLKKDSGLNKSADGSFNEGKGEASADGTENNVAEDAVDDEDEEWFESLGMDEKEMQKINNAHARQLQYKDMADDFSDISVALIEGVECQAFFNFLLNAKSTITSVGRLAGVPPTLLAPIAFPKATIQNLSSRSNKVRMDGVDYFSVEFKGIVLPTVLPYACSLLCESKETFSVTMASNTSTLAFSKASAKLTESVKKEDEASGEQVFGKENLSDCGLHTELLDSLCRTGENSVGLMERVCFKKGFGYAWS